MAGIGGGIYRVLAGEGEMPVNVAHTYGTLFTGAAIRFGGDSEGLQRETFDDLLKKGQEPYATMSHPRKWDGSRCVGLVLARARG